MKAIGSLRGFMGFFVPRLRQKGPIQGPHPLGNSPGPGHSLDSFEQKIIAFGEDLVGHIARPGLFRFLTLNFWRDKMVKMGMENKKVGEGLTKLVQSYSRFDSRTKLRAAVANNFKGNVAALPWYVRFGLRYVWTFRLAVSQISKRFVMAPTIAKAVRTIIGLEKKGLYVVMDMVGESAKTAGQAYEKFQAYKTALEEVVERLQHRNLSLKLTALTTDLLHGVKRNLLTEILSSADKRAALASMIRHNGLEDLIRHKGALGEEQIIDAVWSAVGSSSFSELVDKPGEREAFVEMLKDILLSPVKLAGLRGNLALMPGGEIERVVTDLLGDNKHEKLKGDMRELLRLAIAKGTRLTIDMEEYKYKDVTFRFFRELLEEEEFQGSENLELVVQAYLKDAGEDIQRLSEWAKQRREKFGARTFIRLVKGAYQKSEKAKAQKRGYANPICKDQAATDENYDQVARFILDNYGHFRAAFASHNTSTLSKILTYAKEKGVKQKALEVQMLYGMSSERVLFALARMGYRAAFYGPIGPSADSIEYLARRMDENKNMQSCLGRLQQFFDGVLSLEELLLPQKISLTI